MSRSKNLNCAWLEKNLFYTDRAYFCPKLQSPNPVQLRPPCQIPVAISSARDHFVHLWTRFHTGEHRLMENVPMPGANMRAPALGDSAKCHSTLIKLIFLAQQEPTIPCRACSAPSGSAFPGQTPSRAPIIPFFRVALNLLSLQMCFLFVLHYFLLSKKAVNRI